MESMKESEVVINIESTEKMKEEIGGGGKVRKERRMSGKKPPRPPCRGLSLDAADQKLIKEISDLLIIKRARIQRIKKSKAAAAAAEAKGTSSSSSTTGNLIAMLFTLVFCILIIFQGWQPGSSRGVGIISPKAGGDDLNLKASSSSVHMLSQVIGSSSNTIVGGEGEGEGKGEGAGAGEGGRDIH